ncbi:hypothetical protein [Herbidospora yilanensis]|uniref:hypothetical protein n=1 Tax=Herbidospora yilanensis TaxID=354426 RepID=UPI0007854835|nr:hypothetical protein [Herbidospora yilanensis]
MSRIYSSTTVHCFGTSRFACVRLDSFAMMGRTLRFHRIQYPHKHAGLTGAGIAIATVCAALPGVLSLITHATTQHLVVLTGIDPSPGSRYKLCVPSETPPKFWPIS